MDKKLKVIALNNDILELKEKIKQVVKDHLKTDDDIHVSVVYYEAHSYKKPLKKKKK